MDAMEQVIVKQGEEIIRQGDKGDHLYIVDEGKFVCTRQLKEEGEEINSSKTEKLAEYESGGVFGELALLYNAPRAATITALTDSVLYSLDRHTFNHIVRDAAVKRKVQYEQFLLTVPLFKDLDAESISQIADVLKEKVYDEGTQIITQGEEGNDFYLVMEGEAEAIKVDGENEERESYGAGGYFGWRALLRNEPRAANVVARSRLRVAVVDRKSFKRLLGPKDLAYLIK